MPTAKTLDDRIDQLYAGPADGFIAARDELAKELRSAKDKDGAATVKALRKPTAAAWAVNQLAHTARRDIARLLDVGEALREAHEALADGKGDAGIRTASTKRRKLVGALTEKAVALLGAGGEAQREAISNTFDAAVADPDAGITVQEGRLVKELAAPSGLGAGLVVPTAAALPRESSARREERRAARAAAKNGPSPEPAPLASTPVSATPVDRAERPTQTTKQPAKAAAAEQRRRLATVTAESERRTADAQQAARDAGTARQEVSRLQDLLVSANAKAKAAGERAGLAQWAATTAQQALRDENRPGV